MYIKNYPHKLTMSEIDDVFLEKWGEIPKPRIDKMLLFNIFKHEYTTVGRGNLFGAPYEEDMVHCKFCEFIGLNPIHPKSMIRYWGDGKKKRAKKFTECVRLVEYRNYKRTPEQLKEASSGRVLERLIKIWKEHTGQKTYTVAEVEESVKERYGEKCFLSDTPDPEIDHIFALDLGWDLTPKNACPLKKSYNASKRATLPIDYFTPEQLEKLSKLSGYTLEEFKTQTYNFPFWDWCDKNWDKVEDYIDSRKELKGNGGKERVKDKLRETINKTKRMRNIIDNI